MAKVLLHLDGHAKPVEADLAPVVRAAGAFDVLVGGRSGRAQVYQGDDDQGRLVMDGRVIPFFVHRDGAKIEVWVGGRTYRFTVAAARRAVGDHRTARGLSGEVRAPMPGTILKVCVSPGEVVTANQPLVIMISMKMEMTLTAPMHARVKSIACQPEQLVEMHAVLVTLEEIANDAPAA